MDEKTLNTEIETFFKVANIGYSDKKKLTKRLPESISFLQSIGVALDDIPNDDQIEQLRAYLNTLKYHKGNEEREYKSGVIRDWVNRTKDFYNIRNGNSSDNKSITEAQITIPEMEAVTPELVPERTDYDSSTTDNELDGSENFYQLNPASANHSDSNIPKGDNIMETENNAVTVNSEPEQTAETPSTVEAIRKPGRPETTGRTEKFTLYMTPELWKKINMLADLDELKITQLMNDALEYYCDNERKDDLEFLYELEQKKQERRLKKSKH